MKTFPGPARTGQPSNLTTFKPDFPKSQNGRTASLSQRAYEQIKQKIVSLELPPGSVILEAELQAELGFGRTPVREALRQLSLEKLVLIAPRRGMFVTDIGLRDLQHLCEVRLELETLAVRLAAQRGSEEQWQGMEAALAGLPAAGADNKTLVAIDQRCHELIYEAAGNQFLRDALITMYALSLRLWYFALARVGDMRGAVLEHSAILAALKTRDAALAARLMAEHIKTFQEEIQAAMLKEN
jgi:DNA-binding GntR family transcriptional regulator